MTTAAASSPPFLEVHNGFYGREVGEWLQRAEPADRERFQRVFEDLQKVTEKNHPPPDAAALAQLEAIKSAISRKTLSSSAGKPPVGKAGGWCYTTTKAASRGSPSPYASPNATDRSPKAAGEQQSPTSSFKRSFSAPNKRDPSGHSPQQLHQMYTQQQQAASPGQRPATSHAAKQGRSISSPEVPAGTAATAAAANTMGTVGGFPYGTSAEDRLAATASMTSHEKLQTLTAGLDPSTAPFFATLIHCGESGTASGTIEPSPDITTYQAGFNLKDTEPELFARAVKAGKALSAKDLTPNSENAMSGGADATWRKKYMKSTYTATNEDVNPGAKRYDAAKEEAFFRWMRQQKTYSGDLLANQQDMDELLASASTEKKREIIEALRQVHATVAPGQFKSHSQDVHGPMVKTEDKEYTTLLMEQVRGKTMGRHTPPTDAHALLPTKRATSAPSSPADPTGRPLTPMGQQQVSFLNGVGSPAQGAGKAGKRPESSLGFGPSKAQTAKAGGAQGGGSRPATAPRPARQAGGWKDPNANKPDTFASKVPLKWGGIILGANRSAYADAYGGLGLEGASRRSMSASVGGPIRYREVTCPFGAVNRVTAMAPFREAYPVPESYVKPVPFPQANTDLTMETTYLQSFKPRDEQDVVRSLKAAAESTEAAHKSLLRSTLPLGKTGINLVGSHQWQSEQQEHYVPHKIDIAGDRERAEGLKKYLNGPTASAGKLTASHTDWGFEPPVHQAAQKQLTVRL